MTKHTILFLAANPMGTDRLALDEEARAIHEELERSGHRNQFELVTRWAVRPLDLLRELRKLKPTIVHFSGHGGRGDPQPSPGPHRELVGELGAVNGLRGGLFFQAPDGRPQRVSTAALQEAFGAAGASVKLVVLNACYSAVQAEALLQHVGCVVGMSDAIRDDAARSFAIGFYGGLAERESIAAAYKQACAALSLEGLLDHAHPRLAVRADIEASELVLAADAADAVAPQANRSGADATAPPMIDVAGGAAPVSQRTTDWRPTPLQFAVWILLMIFIGYLWYSCDVVGVRSWLDTRECRNGQDDVCIAIGQTWNDGYHSEEAARAYEISCKKNLNACSCAALVYLLGKHEGLFRARASTWRSFCAEARKLNPNWKHDCLGYVDQNQRNDMCDD